MKKTKIVATIGPASESEAILKQLFLNGVNVCRLNFSHGSHEEYQKKIDSIKKVRDELNLPIAIMLDTKGPEIRVGHFEEGIIELDTGDTFTLTTRDVVGNESIVSISYENLPNDVIIGNRILIDDGLVELEVIDIIDNTDIQCISLNNGMLKNNKGVNVPGVEINLPAIIQKDIDDILFGIKNDVDFIAASFIRKSEDILQIRRLLENNHGHNIEVISKIENQQGVDNIDEIILHSDGIMIARGDLGVEIHPEEIPLIQKCIIQKCNIAGKQVITATQMLDSMMRNPRPTRAEVTDVANAILDGTSAIMLSGETAAGKYPVESVNMMYDIAIKIEESIDYVELLRKKSGSVEISTTSAIGKATCTTAQDLEATAIITNTHSGYTSKAISKFRPKAPIVAATHSKEVMRKLALVWGVYPVLADYSYTTDDIINHSIKATIKAGFVQAGDLVVLTAGIPIGLSGTTNMIKVHTIGKVLLTGTGIGKLSISGKVCIGGSEEELLTKFEEGDIIVCYNTNKEIVSFLRRASGIITEEAGLTSHGAVVGLNLNKPTIVGAKEVLNILNDGDIITIDSSTGQIYKGEIKIV